MIGRLLDASYLLQYGISIVNLVSMSIDENDGDETYTNALTGAMTLLRDVESRLEAIAEGADED